MAGAAHVAHAVLLATPSEGSMTGFVSMLRGARIGLRSVSPLVLFTMPSCYEMLPAPGDPVFVDRSGAACALDLYNPETRVSHRWSIYDPDLGKTFRTECDRVFGRRAAQAYDEKYDEWRKYLGAVLLRARRFHAAVAADKQFTVPVEYHIFGGDCRSTVNRSVVLTSAGVVSTSSWKRPDGMSRGEFKALVMAPGDGRVVQTSVAGQATSTGPRPSEPSLKGASLDWSCVAHDRIQDDAQVQRRVLAILRAEELSPITRFESAGNQAPPARSLRPRTPLHTRAR